MLKSLALTLLVATFMAAGFFARPDGLQSKGLEIAAAGSHVSLVSEIPSLSKTDREDKPNS
jgi:hypothetical protein